jgi:aldose 1-epimerase
LHGVGWRRPWRLKSVREHCCVLRLEHRPEDVGKEDWPFAFDAEQTITLGATGLNVELSLVNTHPSPAPLGLGLHPFFPRRGGERLIFDAAGAWGNAENMLPVMKARGGLWDHGTGQSVGAQELDHDFFGWSGSARIESDRAPTVRISATRLFSMLRVFTPARKDFFAVEPVSHLTNAINRPPDAGAGMFRAAPGARIAGSIIIDMDPP